MQKLMVQSMDDIICLELHPKSFQSMPLFLFVRNSNETLYPITIPLYLPLPRVRVRVCVCDIMLR